MPAVLRLDAAELGASHAGAGLVDGLEFRLARLVRRRRRRLALVRQCLQRALGVAAACLGDLAHGCLALLGSPLRVGAAQDILIKS